MFHAYCLLSTCCFALLQATQLSLTAQQSALSGRERRLEQQVAKLNTKERELATLTGELDQRKQVMDTLQAQLNSRDAALLERERALDQQEKEWQDSVASQRQELEARAVGLVELEAAVAFKER